MKNNGQTDCQRIPKVLVLGDDVRSLLAVMRSFGRGGLQVHVAGHPSDSPARRSRYAFRQYELPTYKEDEKAWCDALVSLMVQERFDLVVPCSDPFQIPLQRHREQFECHGSVYLLDDDVFNTVSDKLRMNELARSVGVPAPQEVVVHSAAEIPLVQQRLRLPVVLKPKTSYDLHCVGSRRSVKKAFSWREFETLITQMLKEGTVAVQENFCGRGVGVEFLLDRGRPLLEFQHVRVHEPLHGGGSYYRKGVAVNPELRDAALRLLSPLGYTGVAMVEFKMNDLTGEWVFIEVNGRFWGSLPLAVASGADFPLCLYKFLVTKQTDFPKEYRTGLSCRYWAGDIRWQIANFRAEKTNPLLATSPLTRVVGETVMNVCTLRERSDTFALDDPFPAVDELYRVATSLGGSACRKWHKAWLASKPSRRRLWQRALRAFHLAQTVAFVCKGNVCRSPFATCYARQLFANKKEFLCAGYYPRAGRECPSEAVAAGAQMNVDLRSHRSELITSELLKKADVVFVFDYENYAQLRASWPGARRKVHLLGALAPHQPLWIEDPWGKDVESFRRIYEQIAATLNGGLSELSPV